ncbi:Elongation factor-2 kinase [Entamoeba marina]
MSRQLDLVFLVDTTGSMGAYLQSAKDNINTISSTIMDSEKVDFRFALVEYKEHPPIDYTFPFKCFDFTSDPKIMSKNVFQMQAYGGGGDGAESVTCGFDCAANLPFRPYAAKVIVWIADAPPHGFFAPYDAFKTGCPCGIDFQQVILNCVERDIQIYSVACEPLREEFRHFRDLMRASAIITGGQFIALSSADALGDTIIAGALEEVGMLALVNDIEKKLKEIEGFDQLSEAERQKKIRSEVAVVAGKVSMKQMKMNSIFEGEIPDVPEAFFTAKTFKELVTALKEVTPNVYNLKKEVKEYKPWLAYGGMGWGQTLNKGKKRQVDNDPTPEEVKQIQMQLCDQRAKDPSFDGFTYEEIGVENGSSYIKLGSDFERGVQDYKNGCGKVIYVRETTVDNEHQFRIAQRLLKRFEK